MDMLHGLARGDVAWFKYFANGSCVEDYMYVCCEDGEDDVPIDIFQCIH